MRKVTVTYRAAEQAELFRNAARLNADARSPSPAATAKRYVEGALFALVGIAVLVYALVGMDESAGMRPVAMAAGVVVICIGAACVSGATLALFRKARAAKELLALAERRVLESADRFAEGEELTLAQSDGRLGLLAGGSPRVACPAEDAEAVSAVGELTAVVFPDGTFVCFPASSADEARACLTGTDCLTLQRNARGAYVR